MNLKITLLLALLVAAGAGAWAWLATRTPAEATSPTLEFVQAELKPENITRVEVARGKQPRFVLEKVGDRWTLPGAWPVRAAEVEGWLRQLADLHTRFVPRSTEDAAVNAAVSAGDALTVTLTVGGKKHVLRFGEEAGTENRFARPTYLKLDDRPDVLRLGPGIGAALDRPQEYFQQRRLFPVERVARDEDAVGPKEKAEKVEQLAARAVEVKGPATAFQVAKAGDAWQLKEPVTDRVDPAKLKALLAAVPDLWAEKFVEKKDKKLEDFGLKDPAYVVSVLPAGGRGDKDRVKLLVGGVSDKKTRVVKKAPPPQPFGGPPPQPQVQIVTEEYRYARLEGNEQIFEVKADKLNDIAVAADALRDPQLARFKAHDVKRLEITTRAAGDTKQQEQLVLVKSGERWQFEQPTKEEAETRPVEELLDKLTDLRVGEKEMLDKVDPKTVGLDQPGATVKVTVREEKEKDGKKEKSTREHVFRLGTKEKEADKLYVTVDAWPRVNQVAGGADDGLLKLARRPALAYRSRRVLDVAAADLKRLEVRRPGETFALEKQAGGWQLAEPVKAPVEAGKAEKLAEALGKLEGVEFVAAAPKADDLEKVYGLTKPALTVKLAYQDAKKPAQTLALGHERAGKQDYYARLDDGPVFAVKKELHDDLARPSLSYRPLGLWKFDEEQVAEVAVRKDGPGYRLKRDGVTWKVAAPFEAPAVRSEAESVVEPLINLTGERFETHQAKDAAKYGLDKPAYTVDLTAAGGKHTLRVGKPVEGEPSARYARADDSEAVVVLGDKTLAALERGPLDLLDRELLALDPKAVGKVRVTGEATFTLAPKGAGWEVKDSPAPPFPAEAEAVQATLQPLQTLRAEKFAAYGPKIDWAQYGLDKPGRTVTVEPAKGDTEAKAGEHVVALGKEAAGGGRYARVDNKEAVAVLDAPTAAALGRSHLDFVDPRVLKYDLDTATGLKRAMKGADLELAKRDDAWQIVKPTSRPADEPTVGDVLEKTFRLRAKRVAAYPAKDLKPFGLDAPAAEVTLELTAADGATEKHVLKVGAPAKGKEETDERFALVDKGDKVVVLPAELSRHLVAPVLYFADRNLVTGGPAIEVAELERGPRTAVFTKAAGTWKLTNPVTAEAESADLDDLVRGVQRLRAAEIVADKGADPKTYGLDKPTAQWKFGGGERKPLTLLVGKAEADGRHFGRLAGVNDQVFLLDAKTSGKLLAEYRSRKPWAALDAAQVERLTVTHDGKTFTLRKRDENWSAEREEGKVDRKAVTDTLDALAGLKAERYVADAKADLQLYGLKPPAWTIEVQTPAGKRTLRLGRTEGESQRYYAAVADSDAVFVLSEADGRRIARPLAAFLADQKAALR